MAVATEMVADPKRFRALLETARTADVLGLDFEFDVVEIKKSNGKKSIDMRTAACVGGSLYIHGPDAPRAYYFPLRHATGANLPAACLNEWLEFAAGLVEFDASDVEASRVWIHNANAEVQVLDNHGVLTDEPRGHRDSMIAAWLLGYGGDRDEGSGFETLGLKDLRTRVLQLPPRREFGDIAKGRRASEVPSHEMAEYAALDAYDTAMIGETLWPRLVKHDLASHMIEVDQPMADICRCMEAEGWDVDTKSIAAFGNRMRDEAAAIAARFAKATETLVVDTEDLPTQIGVYKNGNPKFKKLPTPVVRVRGGDVSNDRDCARFMFVETRALPLKDAVRNKDNTPSLKHENLEPFLATCSGKLGAELVQLRFDFKMRSTLVNTFVVPFTHLPAQYADGKLHSRFEVTGTSTQRLASSNPNTQNCPSRTAEGKAIRKALVALPGWSIGCWDLSQAELRVAAHFSRDPELTKCYTGVGEDIHAGTLAKLHALGWTTAQRTDSKIVNFSSAYRITAPRLAVKMRCHVEVAKVALAAFETRFAGFVEWREAAEDFVKRNGYVRTLDGFKRPLDNTLHYDRYTRKMDLHWSVRNQVANSAIQGSVAGWVKIAMIRIRRELVECGLWHSHVRFKAQEHDSVVAMVRDDVRERVDEIVRRHLTTALPLRVDMKVDGGWGDSWGEAKR